jgi:ketosteroid isomerase-like protein
MSARDGMHKAFLYYFANDGVMLRNNLYPLQGRDSLISIFAKNSDSAFILTWKPLFEKLSQSGDLGYTYGVYTRTTKQSEVVSRGIYATIWAKQKDGSWKFVLDTGTQGLPEASK